MTESGMPQTLPFPAQEFLSAMNRRYACKLFKSDLPLPSVLCDYILECARLSPSSFGLEHWKFIATETPGRASPLFDACFAQEMVATSSLLVTILVRTSPSYHPDSGFIRARSERFPGGYPVFRIDYEGYYHFLTKRRMVGHWARSQAYIAAANMMTGAACANIDSCAIEGFSAEKVLEALGADPKAWSVGLIVAFGYRDEPIRKKIRDGFNSVVEYKKEKQ